MSTPDSAIKSIQSSRLKSLLSDLKTFSATEFDSHFWGNMKAQGGTPLIEDDPNNPNNKIVTFLWKGTAIPTNQDSEQQVYVVRETERYKPIPITENDRLKNIPETHIYFCSRSLPRDLLTSYSFYIQPEAVNMKLLISNLEQYPENNKMLQSMRDQITHHGSYQDTNNPHQFTLHPDPAQRQRHAILDLKGVVLKNPYLPVTRKEADNKLAELIEEKRWIQDSITVPKPEEKTHREYLNNCELIMDICVNEEILLNKAKEWKKTNADTNKILITKDKLSNEWNFFSPQFGVKINGPEAENLLKILQPIDSLTPLSDITENNIKHAAIQFYLSSLDKRDYSVYLPKAYYDSKRQEPLPVMIQLDGQFFADMGIPFLLDKLIDAGLIKPTVVIFLHSAFWVNLRPVPEGDTSQNERSREYNANPSFINFIAEKFLPFIQSQYHVSHDVRDHIMQGASSGGACAILAGLMGAVGQVIADSPVLLMNPEVEKVQLQALDDFIKSKRKTNFITTMGIYETRELVGYTHSLFAGFQKMEEIVKQKELSSQFTCTEVCSEHEFLRWFSQYSDSLIKIHQYILAQKNSGIKSTADLIKIGVGSNTPQEPELKSQPKTVVSSGNQQNINVTPKQQQTLNPSEQRTTSKPGGKIGE